MNSPILFLLTLPLLAAAPKTPDVPAPPQTPLAAKARLFQQNLIEKHLVDGLYIPVVPGIMQHAGLLTGRYLAAVAYQYAVTRDPAIRKHGSDILGGLHRLQEITGKPGLLAGGYVKGHGPVEGSERGGSDTTAWHQGQGKNAEYRWYADTGSATLNAVLYGYAVYYDIAADPAQKKLIAEDVQQMGTALLDPAQLAGDSKPLHGSLFLLADLLIANHITGDPRYLDFYKTVVARFSDNPDPVRRPREFSLDELAKVNHTEEEPEYEAVDSLLRYEKDFMLSTKYRSWMRDLWEMNWMEGNPLFTFMTIDSCKRAFIILAHRDESLALSLDTLRRYPLEHVFRPVMNSLRTDLQNGHPLPINQRPLDSEYSWQANPYQLDGWLRPAVVGFQVAADDPEVAWFADSTGKIYMSRDGWRTWTDMSAGLMGARVQNLAASPKRTFLLYAQTDKGLFLTRDGGYNWQPTEDAPGLAYVDFSQWRSQSADSILKYRIREGQFEKSIDDGQDSVPAMRGWRIPRAASFFMTPRGVLASGPGGAFISRDGDNWTEVKLWQDQETGAADYLHAYWMGRYFGLVP